ncbi:gamma carbonic anhydrase family protein [Alteribacillus sp. HJP-4]|uniref:gamma carbonic anhydrase family protein n=1 Tax=Alteribacillus sp. HJP-4 TaxID=2775394 RepID=UPI0035CCCD4E
MLYPYKNNFPKLHPTVYIAPGARLIGNITADKNVTIWFNAVIRGDNDQIKIKEGTNIQDGAIIHADPEQPVEVGENVTVGHNAILHGCTVKEGALIGMGATVLNGAVIGEGALIAAGAVVGEGTEVKSNTIYAGVPAKQIKTLSEGNRARLKEGAEDYVLKGKTYKDSNV